MESSKSKKKRISVRIAGPDESSELRKIAENLTTAEDLDNHGQRMIDLLIKDGHNFLKKDPWVFLKMVEKAQILIESSYYVEVIQKMADIYRTVPCKTKDGPLEYLVEQLEELKNLFTSSNQEAKASVFVRNQERLLSLIEIIMSADDSLESRSKCLRSLIKNATFISVPYFTEFSLKWTDRLILVLKLLLQQGADATWTPEDMVLTWITIGAKGATALYLFFSSVITIFADGSHLFRSLMELIHLFLNEKSLSYKIDKGTVLHALARNEWCWIESTPEKFFEHCTSVVSKVVEANPSLINTTDAHGGTPLHCFIEAIMKCEDISHITGSRDVIILLRSDININMKDTSGSTALHYFVDGLPLTSSKNISDKTFLEITNFLKSHSNIDIQDNNGYTPLHILAKKLFLHPNKGQDLLTIFESLTSVNNVNAVDGNSVSPYTWILKGKLVHEENSRQTKGNFSSTEEIFLRNGAKDGIAREGSIITTCLWIEEELSNDTGSLYGMQRLLEFIKAVPDWGNICSMSLDKNLWSDICFNLNHICYPKLVHTIMDIMEVLVANELRAQNLCSALVENMNEYDCSLVYLEIMCLCMENGAEPTFQEIQKILSLLEAITANENLTAYLKLLVLIQQSCKDFIYFDLDFLSDLCLVSGELLQLGRLLVDEMYRTLDHCLNSASLIHCLLYISQHDSLEVLETCMIDNAMPENWLQRSPLHLAAIFFDSENALGCLPHSFVEKYIHARDLHGCTPMHVAHLHHNEQAIRFLLSHGAAPDAVDNFSRTPESMASAVSMVSRDIKLSEAGASSEQRSIVEEDMDAQHHKLCCGVIEAKSGVLEQLRPMLVLSETEGHALCEELKELFERIMQYTTLSFKVNEVVIAGSLRERLKVGRFDEADVQIRLVDVEWPNPDGTKFAQELTDSMVKSLTKISWEGIYLRPISIKPPWKFIREQVRSFRGVTISVDVVFIIVDEEKDAIPLAKLQEEILIDAPTRKSTKYAPWGKLNVLMGTTFAHEWDVIDSLPTSFRLALAITKALVEAYDWSKGDHLRVKMPVTSYMLKTALFYLMAQRAKNAQIQKLMEAFESEEKCKIGSDEESCEFKETEGNEDELDSERDLDGDYKGKRKIITEKRDKLKFNPNAQWIRDHDVNEFGEEARILASKMLRLIKFFAVRNYKLKSYFRYLDDLDTCRFGEAEYICDVCDCLLERLEKSVFYQNYSNCMTE